MRTMPFEPSPPLWEMPINIPMFTMGMVASAVGISVGTLRAWMQRGHIRLSADDTPKHTNGAPNRFTLRSVLAIGVTAELVGVGVTTTEAFEIAEQWANFGDVPGEMGAVARREAAGLFPEPFQTYLIVGPEGHGTRRGNGRSSRVIGVDPSDPRAHGTLFGALFDGGRAGGRAVWLNLVDRRVRVACEAAVQGKSALFEPNWDDIASKMLSASPVEGR